MPTKPNIKTLSATAPAILNAIRNNSTDVYFRSVPLAEDSNVRDIGNIIMGSEYLKNEFLNSLVNRIGRVLITSKMYSNPWAVFKKGILEYGETVEEIFVNLANPQIYNPESAADTVYKRVIPDVRTAFHVMDYQIVYPTTVSNDQLRQAFLSSQGIATLIAGIVDAMYTGANYDEFITMKYLLARHLINGTFHVQSIPEVSPENMKNIVSVIKGVSNKLTFASNKYNIARVTNFTLKEDQYLILNSDFESSMNVEVLATSYHMDKAEFMGHVILVDSFGDLDTARLKLLLGDKYHEISEEETTALNAIPGVIVDKDFFMIFDNFYNFTENYNGLGLYWNYFYHTWKTFSVSPFANAVVLVPGTPAVNSVTVNPSAINLLKGQSAQFNAVVDTTNFAPTDVNWSISSNLSSVTPEGLVSVSDSETASSIIVTATSTFDGNKKGTGTITIVSVDA